MPAADWETGDGDAVVAAQHEARSFGAVDTDVFLDSDQPSLYDLFNDPYGEPPRPRSADRAIPLPPGLAQEVEQRMARSDQAGRDFSTVRQPRPAQRNEQGDRRTNALFHVAGRTPLHLRVEVFDIFDGQRWYAKPPPSRERPLRMTTVGGKPWVSFDHHGGFDLLPGLEAHAMKITNLVTHRIPAPLHLAGLHIDRVDREDMFTWAQESVLRLDRDQIPPHIVIHLRSHLLDERSLLTTRLARGFGDQRFRAVPDDHPKGRLTSLATEWAGNVPQGWLQIAEITRRLRDDFRLDRSARVPEDATNAVEHFLFTSRVGDDYLFASASAMLLRSLGYSTRVVSGFYVHPDKYDARQRHTPVERSDVHFWTEVHLGAGSWATIEPTPGYEVLGPPPVLLQRAWAVVRKAWRVACEHPTTSLELTAATIAAVAYRWSLIDAVVTVMWWLSLWRADSRHRVQLTARLLERRARWAGRSRPTGRTVSRWLLSEIVMRSSGTHLELREFAALCDWAAFAREFPASGNVHQTGLLDETTRLCLAVGWSWTRRAMRNHHRSAAPFVRPGTFVLDRSCA